MLRGLIVLLSAALLSVAVAGCAAKAPEALSVEAAVPSPTPFPMSADGLFTGAPQDFLLSKKELGDSYEAADGGTESPNSRVIELRPDGAAYIEATGRLSGWQIQFNRVGEAQGPLYIINVVNIYDNLAGPGVVISREWHDDVWSRIDSGELEQLPDIDGLAAEHLVWQDATGTVGVEVIYRNLYLFFTGPSDGSDNYDFFAALVKAHMDWIMAGEG